MKILTATNNLSRNNYQVQIRTLKSQVDAPYKNLDPELKNPLYSWNQGLKIESQAANYGFDNFLGDANRLYFSRYGCRQTNQVELHSTHY
jgi:hypothetical protein